MKRLALTLVICLGCMGILGAQNVWKPLNCNNYFLGADSDGNLFAMAGYGGLIRSQDEGETWTQSSDYYMPLFMAFSPNGRLFIFPSDYTFVCYSDDHGDTWQQTATHSLSNYYMKGAYAVNNDTLLLWGENHLHYTLDAGATWHDADMSFIGDEYHQIGDVIANEAGDVYASKWYYSGEDSGIFHSTLSDMQNWELAAFDGAVVLHMEFDPEGNVVAGAYWGGLSGFHHEPGFYLVGGQTLAVSDNGIIYKLRYTGDLEVVLNYSTDHGEHFFDVGEALEIYQAPPGGGDDGSIYKGHDNHLYFHGNGQYYKSVQNADEIISDIPTNVVYNIWKPLNLPGSLECVNAQGDLFGTDPSLPGTLLRSQDESETWETVFTGGFGNCIIGNKGRIFLICDRIVNYSDDNGDTWQQTSPINEGTGFSYFGDMGMYSPSNDTLVGWKSPYLTWTFDGGITWDSTRVAIMEDYQEISDLLVNETGDVYLSIWYYYGPNMGVYHSTLSDMRNWELVAFEGVGVKDMAFDPEGNIVCGVYFGGDFSGFEHVPGFYAFWANRVAIADNGIVYKTAMTMYDRAVLAYSLDHGEHFFNTVENLPLWAMAPGGEDGFLSKGYDNHLYFCGNQQYWKSIPNANDIPNVIAFPSEWYYEIQNENGSITYQYICQAGDTIVGDEPSHILVKINTLYDKGLREDVTREYVYMRDGKVYWWNKTLEEFTVLYDFGAQEGDTWVTKVGTETLTMHVDAVEEIEYEGKIYRMLRVSDPDDLFSGDIVCGIGHLTSFFPERLMDNGDGIRVEGMRCYWVENELVFKSGDEDCDAIYSEVHGVDEDGPSTGSGTFAVYPNPTNGVLFVETHGHASLPCQTYRISNLMGQTIFTGNITAENQQIDVSGLPEGMYFITVGDATRKFVVR